MRRPVSSKQWWFRAAAALIPLALLVLLDLALGWAGLAPRESGALFDRRTREEGFTPFIHAGDGALSVRSDWVNPGVNLRARKGEAAGRFFLYPGFRPGRITAEKEPGTIRIFILGGSSAYGLYVGEDEAFSGRLHALLEGRHPDQRWEILNLGCPGWASDRVLNLMQGLIDLDPDLFIVYSGHNELLRGAVEAPSTGKIGFRERLLKVSTLYAWLDHAVDRFKNAGRFDPVPEDEAALNAGQSLVFDPSTLPVEQRSRPSPEALDRAVERYRNNLQKMLALCASRSIPIVLGLPAANLWTPPTVAAGDLLTRKGSPERALFLENLQRVEAGRPEEAIRDLRSLSAGNPQDAGLHYWLGVALVRAGDRTDGLEELQAALDRDVRTHRITGPMEQVFEGLTLRPGERVLDFRPVLRPTGAEAEAAAFFLDHCHPSAEGHERIAGRLLPIVEELLQPATRDETNHTAR